MKYVIPAFGLRNICPEIASSSLSVLADFKILVEVEVVTEYFMVKSCEPILGRLRRSALAVFQRIIALAWAYECVFGNSLRFYPIN